MQVAYLILGFSRKVDSMDHVHDQRVKRLRAEYPCYVKRHRP